jgi:hypothetical protein
MASPFELGIARLPFPDLADAGNRRFEQSESFDIINRNHMRHSKLRSETGDVSDLSIAA